MSEAKALVLAFAGLATPFTAIIVVILETSRSGVLMGLATGLFAALGGWVSSGIVMRYAEIERRKKREELILSR
jgi:uncharacterized membrane protein YdbT with pleckstrin-like domain